MCLLVSTNFSYVHITLRYVSACRIRYIARDRSTERWIHDYWLLIQNEMDVVFQAKFPTLETAGDVADTVGQARLEDLSEKIKV